jgi:hypothetical protein
MIAAEFARFLGLPLTGRTNITDIIEAVCGVCADTKTTAICVEIHNLNIATRAGAEASDTLKYFSERVPATFVFAGINVERAGLLSGARGEQIVGRFSMVRTGPFACDTSGLAYRRNRPHWWEYLEVLRRRLRMSPRSPRKRSRH